MAARAPRTFTALQRWAYEMSGYNRYGLFHDDCLHGDQDVLTALKRIPQEDRDRRNFRLLRAFQLSLTHKTLPKEEWTKIENDKRYLQPYIEEVVRERLEREEWERNH
ncbi:cytochrome b-c1 complex subunit 7-like [Lycorma delicatula]|uniref:cytochrome b-c1 complex subunit 7-like n=1 Tax=Lycorma delicatula TaxID=130591 RepID=UPI003F514391